MIQLSIDTYYPHPPAHDFLGIGILIHSWSPCILRYFKVNEQLRSKKIKVNTPDASPCSHGYLGTTTPDFEMTPASGER